MRLRLLVAGVVGLLVGCGAASLTATECQAECQGCCTSGGLCLTGVEVSNCGHGGALCGECGVGASCVAGACTEPAGDAGAVDAGLLDAGPHDAGAHDAGPLDAGAADAGAADAGGPDAGSHDAGTPDAGSCSLAPQVVLSQVYPSGGNASSSASTKDWVELHNRGTTTVDVSAWALQYAASTGSSWKVSTLPAGTSIGPGGYLLVVMGGGSSGGGALPTPNVSAATPSDLAGSKGKLALTQNVTALTGNCPTGGAIVDFLGYGTTTGTNQVDCFEGATPAPVPATGAALVRGSNTCADTQVNGVDFTAISPPVPHAGGTQACGCP